MKVYKSEKAEQRIIQTYDRLLTLWDVAVKETDISTAYGTTHMIECGKDGAPPLVLFHGVGDDSALMWIFNAKALAEQFHLYAVDTIGGPGKSRPNEQYFKSFDEIKWLDEVLDMLKLELVYLAGVSNGAYITQHYGIMRPDRVTKMICMSGSAVAAGDSKSPLRRMLKVFLPEALFPTDKNIIKLIKKLTGKNYRKFTENADIMAHYTQLIRGFNNMAMTCHKIESFSEEQVLSMQGKALFLCGEADPLGDMETVKAILTKYKLDYRFFPEAGHGINHELSEEINRIMIEYLNEGSKADLNTALL